MRNDLVKASDAARAIKHEFPEIELCVSAGLMEEDQAHNLKEAGIGEVFCRQLAARGSGVPARRIASR